MRRPSGSPRHISVTRTHFRQIYRPTGFPKNSSLSSVSEDRNSSLEGTSYGKSGNDARDAMDTGLTWGSTGTSEPILARTSRCCLGRIAAWVPMI